MCCVGCKMCGFVGGLVVAIVKLHSSFQMSATGMC